MIQMGQRYQPVQIHPANIIFRQNDHMISRHLADGTLIGFSHLVDLIKIKSILIFEHLNKFHEDLCGTGRIVHRPVMMIQGNVQCFCHGIQLEFIEGRQQDPRHGNGVSHREIRDDFHAPAVFLNESCIKRSIVGDQHTAFTELQEFRQNIFDHRRINDHLIADTGELFDFKWNWLPWVYKGAEPIHNLTFNDFDCTDLNDPVVDRRQTGGLQVKHHICTVHALTFGVFHNFLQVIHQISFHSIDDLKVLILGNGMAGLGKCLHTAMICDRQCRHSPGFCTVQKDSRIGHSIHIAHLRMAMQFHSLLIRIVHAMSGKICNLFDSHHGADGQLMVKPVKSRHTL